MCRPPSPRNAALTPYGLGCPVCLPYTHAHRCSAGSSWAHGTSLDFFILKTNLKTLSGGSSRVPLLLCQDGLSSVTLFSLQGVPGLLHRPVGRLGLERAGDFPGQSLVWGGAEVAAHGNGISAAVSGVQLRLRSRFSQPGWHYRPVTQLATAALHD